MKLVTSLAALMALQVTHISAFGIPQRQVVTMFPSSKRSTSTRSSSLSMSENEDPQDALFFAVAKPDTKVSMLTKIPVTTLQNTELMLDELLDLDSSPSPTILTCLSHFGDFNAWEITQQYIAAIESGRIATSSPVVLVGIGSVEAATQFAKDLELEERVGDKLVLAADETGIVTDRLGCYQGWLTVEKKHKERYPATDVNPYLKLLGMVLGFGSPGTIRNVLYGYFGDVADDGPNERQWVVESLLQGTSKGRNPGITADAFNGVSLKSSLRPFELATLRAQTGLHIVTNWSTLGPKDGDLYTRMGGTFIFDQGECLWEHFDRGILNYASVEDICWITEAACQGKRWVPPKSKKQRREEIETFQEDRDARLAKLEAENAAILFQQEAEAQAEAEALIKAAEEEARQFMQKQAQEEARIKAEEAEMQVQEMTRIKAEEEAKLQAEEDVRIAAEQKQARLDAEEAEAFEADAVLKAQQEAAVPKAATAKAEPWPIEAVQRMILQARLRDVQKQLLALASTESPPPALAPEQPWPLEGLQQRLLEARLAMERKAVLSTPTPLPVETATVTVTPSSSPEQTSWPMKGLHQRLLEARLQMERNGNEAPAPVEEEPSEEALSKSSEQTRQLVEAYGDDNLSQKKQKPSSPGKGCGPSEGFDNAPTGWFIP
jgi:hypothetical protein